MEQPMLPAPLPIGPLLRSGTWTSTDSATSNTNNHRSSPKSTEQSSLQSKQSKASTQTTWTTDGHKPTTSLTTQNLPLIQTTSFTSLRAALGLSTSSEEDIWTKPALGEISLHPSPRHAYPAITHPSPIPSVHPSISTINTVSHQSHRAHLQGGRGSRLDDVHNAYTYPSNCRTSIHTWSSSSSSSSIPPSAPLQPVQSFHSPHKAWCASSPEWPICRCDEDRDSPASQGPPSPPSPPPPGLEETARCPNLGDLERRAAIAPARQGMDVPRTESVEALARSTATPVARAAGVPSRSTLRGIWDSATTRFQARSARRAEERRFEGRAKAAEKKGQKERRGRCAWLTRLGDGLDCVDCEGEEEE